jgi:hypothetical protein
MKKIFITLLAVMVIAVALLPAKSVKKHSKYAQIEQFMSDYYTAYNLYAQDAPTIGLMDQYWAPEFLSVQYLPLPQYPVMDLVTWKNFMVFVHLNIKETLKLEEISIDTETLNVVARINIDFNDRVTGALVLNIDAVGFYNLKIDENKKLWITGLKLFFANPAAIMQLSAPPPAR